MNCEICKAPLTTRGMTCGKYTFCMDCGEFSMMLNVRKAIPKHLRRAILARVAAKRGVSD